MAHVSAPHAVGVAHALWVGLYPYHPPSSCTREEPLKACNEAVENEQDIRAW